MSILAWCGDRATLLIQSFRWDNFARECTDGPSTQKAVGRGGGFDAF